MRPSTDEAAFTSLYVAELVFTVGDDARLIASNDSGMAAAAAAAVAAATEDDSGKVGENGGHGAIVLKVFIWTAFACSAAVLARVSRFIFSSMTFSFRRSPLLLLSSYSCVAVRSSATEFDCIPYC